jgi:hypothetical protein
MIGFSFHARAAEPIYRSIETIKITVTEGRMLCKWVEAAAHSGFYKYPSVSLSTNEIKGTRFEHHLFEGSADTPQDFSCGPNDALISSADENGQIEVKKSVVVYELTFQNDHNGPITAIETSETVRLILPDGRYLSSTKMVREENKRLNAAPCRYQKLL